MSEGTKYWTDLRVIETWLRPYADRNNPKIAVLELSTKAVKCLIGKDQDVIRNAKVDEFNFQNFIRNANKTVEFDMSARKFAKQLEKASKIAKFAVILGEDEISQGFYSVKNLETGEQTKISTLEELIKI